MEKSYISGQSISIANPSQLVLSVDEFFRLSKKVPSHDDTLKRKEEFIFSHLGERKTAKYPRILMFEIDLQKIADQVNTKYQDGFDLEDEYDIVHYQNPRTIRTRTSLPIEPSLVKELSPSKIKAIKVGNFRIMEENPVSINKFNTSSLSLDNLQEQNTRVR